MSVFESPMFEARDRDGLVLAGVEFSPSMSDLVRGMIADLLLEQELGIAYHFEVGDARE